MNSASIPALEACPRCHQTYENIGHPLWPGAIMMRTCGCKYKTVTNGSITTVTVDSPEEEQTVASLRREVARLRSALSWYAWPDHYIPRFEGVGQAGIGAKYHSSAESDLGEIARAALGGGDNRVLDVVRRIVDDIRKTAGREENEKFLRQRFDEMARGVD